MRVNRCGTAPSLTVHSLRWPYADYSRLGLAVHGEGFSFVERFRREWADGTNRFDRAGECLLGVYDAERIVGIGGVNIDPDTGDAEIGRVRHDYVLPDWRRFGVGRLLMEQLLTRAALSFKSVRLRTATPAAGSFYEALGFAPVTAPTAMHVLDFASRAQ